MKLLLPLILSVVLAGSTPVYSHHNHWPHYYTHHITYDGGNTWELIQWDIPEDYLPTHIYHYERYILQDRRGDIKQPDSNNTPPPSSDNSNGPPTSEEIREFKERAQKEKQRLKEKAVKEKKRLKEKAQEYRDRYQNG